MVLRAAIRQQDHASVRAPHGVIGPPSIQTAATARGDPASRDIQDDMTLSVIAESAARVNRSRVRSCRMASSTRSARSRSLWSERMVFCDCWMDSSRATWSET